MRPLAALLLLGCADIGPERPIPRYPAEPRPPRETPPGLPAASAPAPAAPLAPSQALPAPRATHLVVIGCDGMSPDGIRKAKTPVLARLIGKGSQVYNCTVSTDGGAPAWTLKAPDATVSESVESSSVLAV